MKRLDRKVATLDRKDPYMATRSWGGHLARHKSSTIDSCRRDPRITARLRELLDNND